MESLFEERGELSGMKGGLVLDGSELSTPSSFATKPSSQTFLSHVFNFVAFQLASFFTCKYFGKLLDLLIMCTNFV